MQGRRAKNSVRWIISAAALIAIAWLGVWVLMRILRPVVVATEAVRGPVIQAFYSTGTIQPEREYPIKSNVAGTVTKVLVDKGDHVKKGDVLAVVSDPALEYEVHKAEAELQERLQRADAANSPVLREFDAKISASGELLDVAKREHQRITDLLAHNAGAQADLDTAIDRLKKIWAEVESLKAQRATKQIELERELQVAKAALSTAQWNRQQQTLASPLDGVVLDRPVSLGTRLAVNDRLMTVADITPEKLVMRAAVDEEDIVKVHPDQLVRLTLYAFGNEIFTGKVARIYDQADPERRTFEIDVRLAEKNERLSPGMTGELAFIMASKDSAVVVPSQAVQGGAVYVIRSDRVQKITPEVGLKSIERTEIRSGIAPGDRVVLTPAAALPDGQRVRVQYMDPVAAAQSNKPPPLVEPFKAFQ
jgi:multidrug efflux pump subunit AcrA (membrane-fusion protein)